MFIVVKNLIFPNLNDGAMGCVLSFIFIFIVPVVYLYKVRLCITIFKATEGNILIVCSRIFLNIQKAIMYHV
jgi:hypothetical protein